MPKWPAYLMAAAAAACVYPALTTPAPAAPAEQQVAPAQEPRLALAPAATVKQPDPREARSAGAAGYAEALADD